LPMKPKPMIPMRYVFTEDGKMTNVESQMSKE